MKKIGLSLAVMLLFFTTFPAFATETKFVFVDLQRVINESNIGKYSVSQLKKKFQNGERNLQNQERRIQTLQRELQQSSLLKESARIKKQDELFKIQQIYTRDREFFFKKVGTEEKKLRDEILTEIRAIINTRSKKKKYDYVFEKNIERFILFSKNSIKDITQEVLREYDKTKK